MNKERNNIVDHGCCFSFSVSTTSSLFLVFIGSHVSFQCSTHVYVCILIIIDSLLCWLSFCFCLKNVHPHTTKILPFDFNVIFFQFPNFIKKQRVNMHLQRNENQRLILIRGMHQSQP